MNHNDNPVIRPYVTKPEHEGRIVIASAEGKATVEVRLVGSGRAVMQLARNLSHLLKVTEHSPVYTNAEGLRCIDMTIVPSTPGDRP